MTDLAEDLRKLVDPYCWGADVTPFYGLSGVPFQCEVLLALKASPDGETPAEARAGLFEAAQKAIGAVEEAGWRHFEAPDISIGGEVRAVHDADGPTLIADGRLKLGLWRPAEEER